MRSWTNGNWYALGLICLWCGGFGNIVAGGEDKAPAAHPDPQFLLQAYETSLVPYERMKGKWRLTRPNYAEEIQRGGKTAVDHVGAVSETFIARDQKRLKTLTTRTDGQRNSPWDSERVAEAGKTSTSVFFDGAMLGRLSTSRENFLFELSSPPAAPFCFGMVYGSLSSPEFLRTSPLSAEADVLDGHPVDVLCGATDTTHIKVWLDPALNHTARKLSCIRKTPYKNTAELVFSPELLAMEPAQHTCEYVVKSFREVGGRHVPEKVTVTYASSASAVRDYTGTIVNGRKVFEVAAGKDEQGKIIMAPAATSSWELELLQIDFDPQLTDADFRISQPVPNGTRISMQDAPQQGYVWENGQMVQGTDTTEPSAARVARVNKDSPSLRQRWILGGGAVFLLAVAIATFCYRRGAWKRRN